VVIYLLNSTLIFLGLSSSWNDLFVGALLVASVAVTCTRAASGTAET
jgi:simple sugar transport system permease protein